MSFFSGIVDRIRDLRDYISERYQSIVGSETELGEAELFDEEIEEAERDIEDAEAEIDELEIELGSIDEDTADELHFPDWINPDTIERIVSEIGVTDYIDLTDKEKDEYMYGWRGFDGADVPAMTPEQEEFRREIQEQLNLSDDIMDSLSDEDLMSISLMSDSGVGLAREFEELTPEEVASEMDLIYRGTFETFEDFINSRMFDFMMDRPDLFDLYINEEGEVEIYETKDTN